MTTVDPGPAVSSPSVTGVTSNVLRRLGRDTVYLLSGLPLAVVTCAVLLVGLGLGVGLLVTVVGVPVLVGVLRLGRQAAAIGAVASAPGVRRGVEGPLPR